MKEKKKAKSDGFLDFLLGPGIIIAFVLAVVIFNWHDIFNLQNWIDSFHSRTPLPDGCSVDNGRAC